MIDVNTYGHTTARLGSTGMISTRCYRGNRPYNKLQAGLEWDQKGAHTEHVGLQLTYSQFDF